MFKVKNKLKEKKTLEYRKKEERDRYKIRIK
jgi:hypothetical protein